MKTFLSKITVAATLLLMTLAATAQTHEATRLKPRNSEFNQPLIERKAQAEQVEVLKPMSRAQAMSTRLRAPLAAPMRPIIKKTASTGDAPKLCGAVIFADSWSKTNKPYGLYNIASAGCEMFIEGVTATDGGVLVDDKTFYAHQLEEDDFFGPTVYIKGYDITTGNQVLDEETWFANRAAADITYDPSTGNVYGIFWTDDEMTGYQLGSINYSSSTLKVSKIMDLPGDWCAIAADSDGLIYMVRREIKGQSVVSSKLYVLLNSEEGLVGSVGDEETVTGALPLYMSSMTYDETSGKLLWNVSNDSGSAIYELDPTTGKATKLYDLPDNEEIMGLYVARSNEADAGIPSVATDVTANFPLGALTGNLTFTAPAIDKNKSPLSGTLNYIVNVDDKEAAKGTCEAGETVEVPLTLTSTGNHKFDIKISNDKGSSEVATISFYAGFATPMAPTNVVMTVANGKATVTWDKVAGQLTKGYFDPDNITYNVTRNPGGVEVLTGTTETTFSETLPEPDGYTVYNYSITAVHNGLKSTAAKSNSYTVGQIEPPYLEEFDNASSLDAFTAGRWKFDSKGFASLAFGTTNDWLITPGIKLEGGKTYNFSVDMACYISWNPERFEVLFGSASESSAMIHELISPTDIDHTQFITYSGALTPEKDGIYYIGIHNLSTDPFYLYADNIRVDAAFDNDMPAEITDFVATGDPNGKIKVNISLTAPELTFDGRPLESIDRIEIKRGETLVHTFASPKPGEKLTCVDSSPAEGENTYTAVSISGTSQSTPVTAMAFAGLDRPSMPTGLKVTETADGVLTVSWDKVTTGVHGGPINPDLITYDIATFDGVNMDIPKYGVTEGPVTFRAIEEGQQEYMQVIVFPIIQSISFDEDDIEGEPAQSAMIPVGTPAKNYRESFAGAYYSTTLGIDAGKNSTINLYNSESNTPAQDDDNGFIGIRGTATGASAAFKTGKIELAGMVKPALTFYSFTIVDPNNGHASNNKIEISVALPGEEFTPVLSTTVSEISNEEGWHLVNVPLDAYTGKTIIVSFRAETVNQQFTLFDNLRIGSSLENDIALTQVSAPSRCNAGATYSVNVLFENTGVNDAEGFGIALYQDNRLVEEKSAGKLISGGTGALRFDVTMHPLATENVTLHAEVVYDADSNAENNKSESVEVRPIVPTLPVVADLSGELVNNKPTLSWSEPAFDQYAWSEPVTESFENGVSFAKEFEGWTFVDNDKKPTGVFKQFDMPGIENGSLQSFWVFDATLPALGQYASSFAGFVGDKYLAAMYTQEGSNDDWAISPELSGESQFISFYARSYSSSVSEKFEILYSTTGTDLDSFEILEKVNAVPRAWTFYEVELPAGARYFAVRYCATDAMMLMLDQFVFTPKGTPGTLALEGFNIYRDNELLNETPVEDFEFTDEKPLGKTASYAVTAVYSQGESAGSNTVALDASGIDSVENGAITVTGLTGKIVITGAEDKNVTVFNTSGMKVYEATGTDHMTINIHSGLYIVTVGDITVKTIVK